MNQTNINIANTNNDASSQPINLITDKQLHRIIGRSLSSLRKDRISGKGVPYIKHPSGSVYYDMRDVFEFIENNKRQLLGRLLFLRGEQHLLPFGFDVTSNRGVLDLHSIALLITLMYAKENNLTDWKTASKSFLNSLFNEQIGTTLGLALSSGDSTQTVTVNDDLSTGMKLLWNDVDGNNIDSITYAIHNAAFKPANDNFIDITINRFIVA